MSIVDDILSKLNLKYEDLSSAERNTLNEWIQVLDSNQLTLDGIKGFVKNLRDSVENQLIDEPEFINVFIFKVLNRNQILLKARLKNLILIDAFLSTPEKAKKTLQSQIAGMVSDR